MQERYVPEAPVPEAGQMVAVANGVYWLRMPLPLSLDHINLYLIEDHDGWFLVDTGIFCPETCDHLGPLLRSAINAKPLKGILITHHHPDHLGCAGWLMEQSMAAVWISEPEYRAAQNYFAVTDKSDLGRQQQFYIRAGIDADETVGLLRLQSSFAGFYRPLPKAPRFFRQGQELVIGGHRWEVRITRGHSPGHVCLYRRQDGVLLSGDQVLPLISPNVSVYSDMPEANPLEEWICALNAMLTLPDNTLVLPAHNFPFRGLPGRIRELLEGHSSTLERLLGFCIEPHTAAQLGLKLYPMAIEGFERMLALGETLAHLNYLVETGALLRSLDQSGQYWFAPTGTRSTKRSVKTL